MPLFVLYDGIHSIFYMHDDLHIFHHFAKDKLGKDLKNMHKAVCFSDPNQSDEKEMQRMSYTSSNQLVNPNAREAMDKFKMEAASEVGVNLKNGYNGDLTSRQAGSVGGQMVKKMIEAYENGMK